MCLTRGIRLKSCFRQILLSLDENPLIMTYFIHVKFLTRKMKLYQRIGGKNE